jgi:uncharacterized lipoprotein YajG
MKRLLLFSLLLAGCGPSPVTFSDNPAPSPSPNPVVKCPVAYTLTDIQRAYYEGCMKARKKNHQQSCLEASLHYIGGAR